MKNKVAAAMADKLLDKHSHPHEPHPFPSFVMNPAPPADFSLAQLRDFAAHHHNVMYSALGSEDLLAAPRALRGRALRPGPK